MIKKTITYENYNGEEVSEDFYFNLTKLELVEQDLEAGGLEETANKLMETKDAKKAYGMFKDIILSAVGVKSDDGRRFIKSQEIRDDFEASPALAELIIEFLKDPETSVDFIRGLLPQKAMKEIENLELKKEESVEGEVIVEKAKAEDAVPTKETELTFDDYSREDLLTMPKEQFDKLVPRKPADMTKDQLLVAMQRKSGDHDS